MEFLFGETAAKMNVDKLVVIAINATISMVALALIYRPLALDCVDPGFLRSVSRAGRHRAPYVSGAAGAQSGQRLSRARHLARRRHHHHARGDGAFWTRDISAMIVLAIVCAMVSGWDGPAVGLPREYSVRACVTLVAGLLYLGVGPARAVGGSVWRLSRPSSGGVSSSPSRAR